MTSIEELWRAPRKELLERLRAGYSVAPEALAGALYRGVSLGLPRFVEALTWKKFGKAFVHEPDRGVVRGWNVRMLQSALDDGAWEPLRKNTGEPVTFGHFEARAIDEARLPRGIGRCTLLDYGRGCNSRLDIAALLRDPVVALDRGSNHLLLGWSYVELGVGRFGTPSYFTLERGPRVDHVAEPPRRTT